jgi:hypothetical protein
MSLWCSSSHAALSAGEGDPVQLFALPSPWRTLGVLRVRNGSDRRTPGEYDRVHLGRQDSAQCALQDLRMCHALGATCPRARRQARCQSEQLRSAPSRGCSGTPVRWSGHLEIHRLSGTAAVPPNPSIEGRPQSGFACLRPPLMSNVGQQRKFRYDYSIFRRVHMWVDSLCVLTQARRDAQLPLSGLSAFQRRPIRFGLHRRGLGHRDHWYA